MDVAIVPVAGLQNVKVGGGWLLRIVGEGLRDLAGSWLTKVTRDEAEFDF
jgi:hypothetical protein